MRDALFHLPRTKNISLQAQIREMLVDAILRGQLLGGAPIPSSRQMAHTLGVSRNTVVLAYQSLVDDNYLLPRERSGYYVNPDLSGVIGETEAAASEPTGREPNWSSRLRITPTLQENVVKPLDWPDYPYPFVYGQIDRNLFPLPAWRECARQALGRRALEDWTGDRSIHDDPMLIEQIRSRILPKRGIQANDDEILITMGAQNGLYIAASLLFRPESVVGLENPGYPDMRNIVALKTHNTVMQPVDHDGMIVDDRLDDCDYICVTPSHHSPTTATMPLTRREALLEMAAKNDAIIIEDDYESETNFGGTPTPALKSLDRDGRVIYIGSFSKSMFPGLRLGFMVCDKTLIDEARAIRRLMLRHPSTTTQRHTALFLALGHHDTLIHRVHREYRKRWETMADALAVDFPNASSRPSFGGSSFWVRGPEHLDDQTLMERARAEGVLIEPGRLHFHGPEAPRNFFRLAYSSISEERIGPGIKILSRLVHECQV